MSDKIPWEFFEKEFTPLYSTQGCPAKPIRLMVGLLILKQMNNLSEEIIVRKWTENPYYQYLCGEAEFQWKRPCDPSDIHCFRKRIGEKGVEKILAVSIAMHAKKVKTIAGCLVRELWRVIPDDELENNREELDLFQKVLDQKKGR